MAYPVITYVIDNVLKVFPLKKGKVNVYQTIHMLTFSKIRFVFLYPLLNLFCVIVICSSVQTSIVIFKSKVSLMTNQN